MGKVSEEEEEWMIICYIHMKFLNYPNCRYEIASATSGAISKHEAVLATAGVSSKLSASGKW